MKKRMGKEVLCALTAAGIMCAAQTAAAVTLDDLGLSDAQKAALAALINAPASSPGIAFGSPVGFGMDYGQLAISIGGATVPKSQQASIGKADGSMSLGAGLGDAKKYLGLEVTANLISLRGGFAEDGSLNTKLHFSLPQQSAMALGVENIGRWGDAKNGYSSAYAAYTKFFELTPGAANSLPLSVNIGVGDGRFHSSGKSGLSAFGGVALFPTSRFSVIADYTGRDLNAGVSYVPFLRTPLTITLGLVNLTEKDNQDVQFSGGLGYSYRF